MVISLADSPVDASTKSEARAKATQATGLSASEITISQADGEGFRVEFPDARSRAADQIDEEVPTSVNRSDVKQTEDGGYQLTADAQKSLATQQFDEDISSEDINRVDVERTEDGSFTLTEQARNRVGLARTAEEYGVSRDEIGIDEGRIVPESEEAARAFAEEQAQEQAGGGEVEVTEVAPGIYRGTVTQTEGDVQPSGDLDRLTATVATPEGKEFLEQADRYARVESAMREQAQEAAVVDASEEAERRQEQMQSDFERGALGDPREIAREMARENREQDGDGQASASDLSEAERTQYGATAPTLEETQQRATAAGQASAMQTPENPFEDNDRGAAESAAAVADAALVNAPSSAVDAVEAEAARPDNERFGDGELRLPNSEIAMEDVLTVASDGISNIAQDVGESVGDAVPGDDDSAVSNFASGFTTGVIQLANVPAFALGAKEAGEAAGYLVENSDQVNDAFDAGVEIGERAADYAQENPYKTGGVLTGSIAGSGAAVSLAGRYSATAGARVAVLTEPGEQIAESVATRALSRTARGRQVLQRLPGQRAGVENVALAAGRGISRRAKGAVGAARARLATPDGAGGPPGTFTRSVDAPTSQSVDADVTVTRAERNEVATRIQAAEGSRSDIDRVDLASGVTDDTASPPRFGRPGGDTDTGRAGRPDADELGYEATGPRGGESEPLGSGGGGPLGAPTRPRQQTVTPDAPSTGSSSSLTDRLPLYDDIEAAGGVRPFIRGEDLPSRVPESAVPDQFRDFLDDTRGTAGIPGTGLAVRAANRAESDTTDATDGAFRDYSNVDQDPEGEIRERAMADLRQTEGDFEPTVDAFNSDGDQATFELREPDADAGVDADATQSADAVGRVEDAQSPEVVEEGSILDRQGTDAVVRVDAEVASSEASQAATDRIEDAVAMTFGDSDADTTPQVGERPAEDVFSGTDTDVDVGTDVAADTDIAVDARSDVDIDTTFDTVQMDAQMDVNQDVNVRQNFNSPFEASRGRRQGDLDFEFEQERRDRGVTGQFEAAEETFSSGILQNPLDADLV